MNFIVRSLPIIIVSVAGFDIKLNLKNSYCHEINTELEYIQRACTLENILDEGKIIGFGGSLAQLYRCSRAIAVNLCNLNLEHLL